MKHLRILYGADDKFDEVNNTLLVSKGYFDTTKVVNSGPPSFIDKLRHHNHVIFENLDWFTGDQEPCRRAFYHDVPEGDWVLWLDSDERPCQGFFDNIDSLIQQWESENVYNVRFPYYSHHWWVSPDGQLIIGKPWLEKPAPSSKDGIAAWGYSVHDRMFRKTKKTCSTTNFGGHGYVIGNKENSNEFDNFLWAYCPYPINHIKDDLGAYQSGLFHNFTTQCRNMSYKDAARTIETSDPYKRVREFQIREGVFTTNQLVLKAMQDPAFRERLVALYSDPVMDTPIDSALFQHNKIWATRFAASFGHNILRCGDACCKYKEMQL